MLNTVKQKDFISMVPSEDLMQETWNSCTFFPLPLVVRDQIIIERKLRIYCYKYEL